MQRVTCPLLHRAGSKRGPKDIVLKHIVDEALDECAGDGHSVEVSAGLPFHGGAAAYRNGWEGHKGTSTVRRTGLNDMERLSSPWVKGQRVEVLVLGTLLHTRCACLPESPLITAPHFPHLSLQHCLVLDHSIDRTRVTMKPGRDVWWLDGPGVQPTQCPVVWVGAEDPLFKLYTSGSTGGWVDLVNRQSNMGTSALNVHSSMVHAIHGGGMRTHEGSGGWGEFSGQEP